MPEMALAGEGARSDAIDDRRRRGSVTTLFLVFLLLCRARAIPRARPTQVRMRTERCGRCVGCGIRRSCIDPFLDRSHLYNIICCRTSVSSPTNYTVARGRVTVNRVEHRALGLAVLLNGHVNGARTAHIRYMGPFMGPALVASCAATPLTAQPDAPCA